MKKYCFCRLFFDKENELMEVYNLVLKSWASFQHPTSTKGKKIKRKNGDRNSLTLHPLQDLVCIPNLHRK